MGMVLHSPGGRIDNGMKLLIVLVSLLTSPLTAPFTQIYPHHETTYYQDLVEFSGCRAQILFDENASPAESFFDVDDEGPYIYLGVREEHQIPYYVTTIIVLHETGHCLQYQAGTLGQYRKNPKLFELDADRQAADLACAMGMDGRRMLIETMEWARDVFGYTGDLYHGTLSERMAQGDLARRCNAERPQSPYLSEADAAIVGR